VSDNGQGLAADLPSGGIGWVSMRERAMAFGGVFSVHNNHTPGTTVEVVLPLSSMNALEEPSWV
jgi:signal transduction histidine kinase